MIENALIFFISISICLGYFVFTLSKENDKLKQNNKRLADDRFSKLFEICNLKHELSESIANREHKANRINELMEENNDLIDLAKKADNLINMQKVVISSIEKENKDLKENNSKLMYRNGELINRRDELICQNNTLYDKVKKLDETLKAYDRAQGQSTGHCRNGNYKELLSKSIEQPLTWCHIVEVEPIKGKKSKTKKRK